MILRNARIPLAYGVFLFAGMAGLGCQLIWARLFLAGMGHEMPSLVAVLAAFMCGLALGAGLLDRPISRSRRPERWLGGLLAVAGVWSLLTIVIIPWLNPMATRWLGPSPAPLAQWALAFSLPVLVLLPATAALGASFTAMERVVAGLAGSGRHVAALYAVNTLGAAMGVLLATGWLMPLIGLRASALVFAVIPLVGAALSLAMAREGMALATEGPGPAFRDSWPGHRLAMALLITGLLGIGYQLLVVRVLAQVLDNTIYTYAIVLTVYLGGTALGAAGYRRVLPEPEFRPVLVGLCGLLAATCLVGVLVLGRSGELMEGLRGAMSGTWAGRALAESAMVALVFMAPAMVMGATWSHLVQGSRRADGGIGAAVALNALGCALAPLLFGVLLLPVLRCEVEPRRDRARISGAGAASAPLAMGLGRGAAGARPVSTGEPADPGPASAAPRSWPGAKVCSARLRSFVSRTGIARCAWTTAFRWGARDRPRWRRDMPISRCYCIRRPNAA
jgi:spermidine synthase